ncbi:MAG: NAD(P)/FAD-dependent oxidoreductase, partial [Alphaproteobacteria bacterium]
MNEDAHPINSRARPRVVIVGAGFGGLTCAKALAQVPVDITLIDRSNYHLFQPLLYQVATAGLSPADIAAPIRFILRRQKNVRTLLGEVTGIDTLGKRVLLGADSVPYDELIVATGARHSYFGHDWQAFAPGLKTVEDATAIRSRILSAFEKAEAANDPAEQRKHLNFVIVGGGPTGVELAGAIAELAKRVLVDEFRRIDPRTARVLLLEGAARVLPGFNPALSAYAKRALRKLGVEVRTEATVRAIDAERVVVGDETIRSRTVLWAAGVQASPAAGWLGAEHDAQGRVYVEADLTVPGLSGVSVIGDAASVERSLGMRLPGIAPAAKQQGAYVAARIEAAAFDAPRPGPFAYRHFGDLATIGRSAAAVDFGFVRMTGLIAWLLWAAAHIF